MGLFSATIKVPVSTLQEQANKLSSYAEQNEDIFDKIYNAIACLETSGEWEGSSVVSALNATKKQQKNYAEVVSAMNSLAAFLKDFAEEISERDSELAESARAIL